MDNSSIVRISHRKKGSGCLTTVLKTTAKSCRALCRALPDNNNWRDSKMVVEIQSRDELVKEYQATQDMIKHYDDLTMRFGTMTQSAILIFIGLAFGLLSQQKNMFNYLFPFVIVFVVMSNLLGHLWFKRHRSISQIKLRRILEIEKQLGWMQFTLVDEAIKSEKIESKPVRKMLVVYHIGLPLILIMAYFVILCRG
jgi:hypothetical protein